MICEECKKYCKCATCVYNPYYATNTPRPCFSADCDICDGDAETIFCNHHLTIEEVNKMIERGETCASKSK